MQTIEQIDDLIRRLNDGDLSAKDRLASWGTERIKALTRGMKRDFPLVDRWEQTDDVLQNVLPDLFDKIRPNKFASTKRFLAYAAVCIRYELIRRAVYYRKRYANYESWATNEEGRPVEFASSTFDPARLAEWTEVHEQIELLPQKPKIAVELVVYSGLTQPEAAEMLGISQRTIRRYLAEAREFVEKRLSGESVFPDL